MSLITLEGLLSDKNPLELEQMLNNLATVRLVKDVSYTGFVRSVDSVSGSLIIRHSNKENKSLLIPGHMIQGITYNKDIKEENSPEITYAREDVAVRKKALLEWLTTNLLPVEDVDGVLKLGNAEIHPPYFHWDIFTDNFMAFNQISDLIKKMPNIKI